MIESKAAARFVLGHNLLSRAPCLFLHQGSQPRYEKETKKTRLPTQNPKKIESRYVYKKNIIKKESPNSLAGFYNLIAISKNI